MIDKKKALEEIKNVIDNVKLTAKEREFLYKCLEVLTN